MQDSYVGDIGDYGKYGLLRMLSQQGVALAVNWYKVPPLRLGKQDDGKYISYLFDSQHYRPYDPTLFDVLHRIVCVEEDRRIERIEQENLFSAQCFSKNIDENREEWHQNALRQTANGNTVFLDPDNGLETRKMFDANSATEKHVRWSELKDYYVRGQNVILYQHRPQMTKKEKCIESVMRFQEEYLKADCVMLLEFPKYTNRFYFIFLHKECCSVFQDVCNKMVETWGRDGFCKQLAL